MSETFGKRFNRHSRYATRLGRHIQLPVCQQGEAARPPGDLGRLDRLEQEILDGRREIPEANDKQWESPFFALGRYWDVNEYRIVASRKKDIACAVHYEVTQRGCDRVFIHFIVNFYKCAFESGDFSLQKPEFLWLHARLHVREYLESHRQPRARSHGTWPVVFHCTGRGKELHQSE